MPPGNALPLYGNEKTMNLNSLVLANIQASPYFKHQLYELKTYHQVIDEIYYKVNHLEPWEKGSRKTAGQTGMCGGYVLDSQRWSLEISDEMLRFIRRDRTLECSVLYHLSKVRGVGTGGIVSSAYCLLYKLYTLKLTRKQVIGLCSHADSSFIRALGLMYIRYTQPPHTFWEWYEAYLDDEEEVDPKAGGGNNMTIGEMAEQLLVKLEWYGTLFPRIPVPVQKDIEMKMRQHKEQRGQAARHMRHAGDKEEPENCQQSNNKGGNDAYFGEAERMARLADREMAQRSAPQHKSPVGEKEASAPGVHRRRSNSRSRSRGKHRSRSRDSRARRSRDRSHERRKEARRRSRSRSVDKKDRKKKSSRHRSRSRSRDRKEKKHHKRSRRSSSRGRHHDEEDRRIREDNKYHPSRDDDFQRDLNREMERVKRSRNGVDCK